MDRPTTVRVLNHDYSIDWVTGVAAIRWEDCGECEYNTQEIRVNTARSLQSQADTLLHEIMHAVIYHLGLDDNMGDTEHVVRLVATTLCTVWRDNPSVIGWLDAAITGR